MIEDTGMVDSLMPQRGISENFDEFSDSSPHTQANPAIDDPGVQPNDESHETVSAIANSPNIEGAAAGGQPLFNCSRCSRTYTRSDHLTRHFKSHTREKPFECPVCNKCFARVDLLKRHALNHTESADHPTSKRICMQLSSIISSKRAIQACKACAASKVRCDENETCQRCFKKGIICEYRNSNRNSPAASETTTTNIPTIDSVPGDMNSRDFVDELQEGVSMSIMSVSTSPSRLSPMSAFSDHTAEEYRGRESAPNPFMSLDNSNESHSNAKYQNLISPYTNSFANFLRDVMVPEYVVAPANTTWSPGVGEPAGFRNDGYVEYGNYAPRDILDFDAGSLELNDVDFGLLGSFNQGFPPNMETMLDPLINTTDMNTMSSTTRSTAPNPQSQLQPSSQFSNEDESHKAITSRAEAFQQSLWLWKPQSSDSHKDYEEVSHCMVPISPSNPQAANATEMQLVELIQKCHISFRSPPRCPSVPTLGMAGRDRIHMMVIRSHDFWNTSKAPSSFPSVQFLDALVELFFNHQGVTALRFLHWTVFKPVPETSSEFLGAVVMAGASMAPFRSVRKFGYGLQESLRKSISALFDSNTTSTRNLQVMQALFMVLYVGVWSGGKRKGELAESHRQSLITMLRRAGRFRNFQYATIVPLADDTPEVLNRKWNTWIELESWKRLVYDTFFLDIQICMTFQVPPLISYAELTLPLTYSEELWSAPNAEAWRNTYLAAPPPNRLPTFIEYFLHFSTYPMSAGVNWDFALFTVLNGICSLIWEYHQIFAVRTAIHSVELDGLPGGRVTKDLILTSRMQELRGMLGNWRIKATTVIPFSSNPEIWTPHVDRSITFSLLQLSLHASFENLQVFAGKEGEVPARNIYPLLQRWRAHDDSRWALWHAGQLIRVFRVNTKACFINDFVAVALYHASLVLWAYGLLGLGEQSKNPTPAQPPSLAQDADVVQMDCEEDAVAGYNFVELGIGKPGILGKGGKVIFLDAPGEVMDSLAELLCWEEEPSPLVESLAKLMKDLGSAANVVGMM
ncbi:hypothetical protein RUND412_003409 [Rhizina undulata]